MIEVALFPIPNAVAFPGVDFPLHVFEPRYRQLVQDCVSDQRLLGICHTEKTIHKPGNTKRREQTIEEALSSNQATYKPYPVFTAGDCEIVETLPDGRLLANVHMSARLQIVSDRQALPYRIVACEPLPDEEPQATSAGPLHPDNLALRDRIHRRLGELVGDTNPQLQTQLADAHWQTLSDSDYSYQIFNCLRFEADLMQHILEQRSAHQRLKTLCELLEQA